MTEGTITWNHVAIGINTNHTTSGSGAGSAGMLASTFKTIVLENEYLRIKLVPDGGGRLISMYYKPTGHEELWAHSNATPMNMSSFYFNWVLVWGGIYPTLTGPEHGKYWFLPWAYEVTKQNDDTVTVAMYMTDSIPWRSGYSTLHSSYGATGLKCTFAVSLISGKTGADIDVTLVNPSANSIGLEYWTCTTLSPGSVPSNLRATGNAELIMPDDTVKINPSYNGLKAQEKQMTGDWYMFNKLRLFKNWVEAGILYAQPKNNFWGVINHDDANREGIMRIADNTITYTCKIWTCGYTGLPYWEPWGGISDEFYRKATMAAGATKKWHEYYTPTVGLDSVTDASDNVLANLKTDKTRYDGTVDDSVRVTCQLFSSRPANQVHALFRLEGGGSTQRIFDNTIIPDSKTGNVIKLSVPVKSVYNGTTKLTAQFQDDGGRTLLNASKGVSFVNASATVGVIRNPATGLAKAASGRTALYSLDGKLIRVLEDALQVKNIPLAKGAYLLIPDNKRAEKTVRLSE
jgi:hypothetical protein